METKNEPRAVRQGVRLVEKRSIRLEPISKMHLTAACGVDGRLNLLTYWSVCCAVSATGFLPATVICYF
jgi:hypothetical protein